LVTSPHLPWQTLGFGVQQVSLKQTWLLVQHSSPPQQNSPGSLQFGPCLLLSTGVDWHCPSTQSRVRQVAFGQTLPQAPQLSMVLAPMQPAAQQFWPAVQVWAVPALGPLVGQQLPVWQVPSQQTWPVGHWDVSVQLWQVLSTQTSPPVHFGQVISPPQPSGSVPQALAGQVRCWQHWPLVSQTVAPCGQHVGCRCASRQQIAFWQFGPAVPMTGVYSHRWVLSLHESFWQVRTGQAEQSYVPPQPSLTRPHFPAQA
jgi:hypothetical protein